MKFKKLDIDTSIVKALEQKGYTEATPIQAEAIPYALKGRDILGCAQTGTGKTAAFLIPTIQLLKKHDASKIRSLVLTPTRELAIQIEENFQQYAKHTNLKSAIVFGGVSQRPQEKAIKNGVDVLVATPGRLLDLMKQRIIKIDKVEMFILDEADRMLDMGFLNDVKKVIAALPEKKQTLFFSATMPKEIKELTNALLHDPQVIEVAPPSSTVEKIKQSLYYVDKSNKKNLLLSILEMQKVDSAIVFTRTKAIANRLGKFLEQANIKVGVIHGNKSQNARQHALKEFKQGKMQILVATDIASRGIDINQLSYVFNYDIPQDPEAYVHRIGRTGRAGKDGISISFCDVDETGLVQDIQKLIGIKIPVVKEHLFPMMNHTPTPKKQTKQTKSSRPKSQNGEFKPKRSSDANKSASKKFGDRPTEKRAVKKFGDKPTEKRSSDKKPGGRPFNKSNNNAKSYGSKPQARNNRRGK